MYNIQNNVATEIAYINPLINCIFKGVAVVVSDPISVSTNVKVIGLPVSLSSPNMKSGSSSEFNDELLTVLKGREKRPKNVQEDVQVIIILLF